MEVLDLDSVDWKASRRDRNRGGPKWKMLTPMSTPRSSHTVEVLEGVIYVVGGGDGREWLCTAESYNPKTLRWSPIARYLNNLDNVLLKGFERKKRKLPRGYTCVRDKTSKKLMNLLFSAKIQFFHLNNSYL